MKNRKIFIDCGYSHGEATNLFLKKLGKEYEYFGFEANPYLYDRFKDKHDFVNLSNNAVWVKNGTVDFYVITNDRSGDWNPYTGASTVMKEKSDWNMNVHTGQRKVTVPSIDFSDFMHKNFKKEDFIVLKMDIEGGEYDVLNKLIADKTLDYVNELYIEFHDAKVGRSSKAIIDYLEAKKIKYDIQITGKKPRVNGKKVAWITMKDYY
jgi:FkbM family methyltransferase